MLRQDNKLTGKRIPGKLSVVTKLNAASLIAFGFAPFAFSFNGSPGFVSAPVIHLLR
jgi:hypothetical protein